MQKLFLYIQPLLYLNLAQIVRQTNSTLDYGRISINYDFAVVEWFISSSEIEFQVKINRKSWLGIGFLDGMHDVDMFVIQVDGEDQAYVTDLWSTQDNFPQVDRQQDYTKISQNVSDSSIQIRFKRKLITGDVQQDQELKVGKEHNWNFAYGVEEQMLTQHTTCGNYKINFGKYGDSYNNYDTPSMASQLLRFCLMVLIVSNL